jgi:hypothetical protein
MNERCDLNMALGIPVLEAQNRIALSGRQPGQSGQCGRATKQQVI